MLRGLVVLLLVANAVFFAWTQGWLAPALPDPQAGEREPERLSRQVRAEQVTVLSPRAAAQAVQAARQAAVDSNGAASAPNGNAESGPSATPPGLR